MFGCLCVVIKGVDSVYAFMNSVANTISFNKAAGELELGPSLLDRTGCSGANFFHHVVFGQGGDDDDQEEAEMMERVLER